MTELLNGRHFEGGAAGNGAAYGAVTFRLRRYIIPHPTIYLLPEFEANWLKNNRVIEWAPPERAPRRHVRHCSVTATLHNDVPS